MKKIFAFALVVIAMLSLTYCESLSNISNEDAYRVGYNTGVMLRGGSSDEFIR